MILVSACLLGCACRYDGQSKPHPLAMELARQGRAVPVCPEQRPACRRSGGESRWSCVTDGT